MKPRERIVYSGVSTSFTCLSTQVPMWRKWNKIMSFLMSLPAKARVVNTSLILFNVTKEDAGIYECEGTTNEKNVWSGKRATFITRGTLLVISKLM